MSKAEEKSLKAYPEKIEWGGKEYSNEELCKEVLKRFKERKKT